jgi:hypothetical protein
VVKLACALTPCVMAMETCCGAHHLGGILHDQGRQVRLMSAVGCVVLRHARGAAGGRPSGNRRDVRSRRCSRAIHSSETKQRQRRGAARILAEAEAAEQAASAPNESRAALFAFLRPIASAGYMWRQQSHAS